MLTSQSHIHLGFDLNNIKCKKKKKKKRINKRQKDLLLTIEFAKKQLTLDCAFSHLRIEIQKAIIKL